jgi:hypothetical protein
VTLHSDEDALPHEHEQMHRKIVDKLLHGGILKATEVGQLIVEREEKEPQPAAPVDAGPQEQRQTQQSGN